MKNPLNLGLTTGMSALLLNQKPLRTEAFYPHATIISILNPAPNPKPIFSRISTVMRAVEDPNEADLHNLTPVEQKKTQSTLAPTDAESFIQAILYEVEQSPKRSEWIDYLETGQRTQPNLDNADDEDSDYFMPDRVQFSWSQDDPSEPRQVVLYSTEFVNDLCEGLPTEHLIRVKEPLDIDINQLNIQKLVKQLGQKQLLGLGAPIYSRAFSKSSELSGYRIRPELKSDEPFLKSIFSIFSFFAAPITTSITEAFKKPNGFRIVLEKDK